jgi:hypothetical protein
LYSHHELQPCNRVIDLPAQQHWRDSGELDQLLDACRNDRERSYRGVPGLIATPNAGGAATTPVSLTVNTPGMFSRFYGTYNSSSAYVVMQNTGGCSITDIFGQCTATNASITSGLVSSLAPGASMTVYASVNQSSGYNCYFQFTGTGASNSPYIDTLF